MRELRLSSSRRLGMTAITFSPMAWPTLVEPATPITLAATQAVAAVSPIVLAALAFAGRAFLTDVNEGTLTISTATWPGTGVKESDRVGQMVEQILLSHPELVSTLYLRFKAIGREINSQQILRRRTTDVVVEG
ncbi:hypothetical protein [Dechloromonas sp. A34]|uniref:hypothetical protein n=1 Tax=Dechloromonas sp. A34 TaxID=447588 RepID=UPI002248C8F3|nr:hypothetical protein [Dechloromonas sp. A34]